MPSTSPDAIYYPDSSTALTPLQTVFATLATSVQTALTTLKTRVTNLETANTRTPYAMAAGTLAITGIAKGVTKSQSVTFPVGRFSVGPHVNISQQTSAPQNALCAMSNASSTGFTAYAYRDDTVGTMNMDWIAVQMKSGSATG